MNTLKPISVFIKLAKSTKLDDEEVLYQFYL